MTGNNLVRRRVKLSTIWKKARAWAEYHGHQHDCHNVQGVAPL